MMTCCAFSFGIIYFIFLIFVLNVMFHFPHDPITFFLCMHVCMFVCVCVSMCVTVCEHVVYVVMGAPEEEGRPRRRRTPRFLLKP